MEEKKPWTKFKTICWTIFLVLLGIITKVYLPLIANDVGASEMQIGAESYTTPQLYNTVLFYAPLVIILALLLTYHKEIKMLSKKIINYIKGENNK